jgi:hypothetical protein
MLSVAMLKPTRRGHQLMAHDGPAGTALGHCAIAKPSKSNRSFLIHYELAEMLEHPLLQPTPLSWK